MAKCEACHKKSEVLHVSPDSTDRQKAVCPKCYEKAFKATHPDAKIPHLVAEDEGMEVEDHLDRAEQRVGD